MKNLTITSETTAAQISDFLYSESDKRIDFDKVATRIKNISKLASGYMTKHMFGFWLKTCNGVTTIEKY